MKKAGGVKASGLFHFSVYQHGMEVFFTVLVYYALICKIGQKDVQNRIANQIKQHKCGYHLPSKLLDLCPAMRKPQTAPSRPRLGGPAVLILFRGHLIILSKAAGSQPWDFSA